MSSDAGGPPPKGDIRDRMERMYRPQKLIYDLSRKYYLIGRDLLISGLDASPAQRILDLGCGTGRNLVAIGRRWPETRLYGIDAAAAMVEVATAKLAAAGLADRAVVARADAETVALEGPLGIDGGLDHITISYALSMMDHPLAVIDRALGWLAPGGRLHIVDFGPMTGLPGFARAGFIAWLDRFGVRHRPEVEHHLAALAQAGRGTLERRSLLGGYAVLLRFTTARSAG